MPEQELRVNATSHHEATDVVVAVDQGTGSTKAIALDFQGQVVARSSVPVSRTDPRPGWVEQDALEIRDSVVTAMASPLDQRPLNVTAVGLSNQRESAVVWDRQTGRPLGPMLGWQDRRTTERATAAYEEGWGHEVRSRTGLPLDPMFSALKLGWLLDQVDPDRAGCRSGRIAVGTVDSWLLFSLTGEHRIEIGNASRTQLLNLERAEWDADLAERFNTCRLGAILPDSCVKPAVPRDYGNNPASIMGRWSPFSKFFTTSCFSRAFSQYLCSPWLSANSAGRISSWQSLQLP
ncbi:FGGY family carbohydrate kinase [Pseudarthrobacter sp. NPDC080037]|uniref:FGGY family carbohydrate kinase n=1 Tax=Pseudarthrobacter sp. NPDC080037 TaxID=3155289 RepID=UPI00344C21CD